MALVIRPMTLEDIPQVHAIDKLSFSLPWPERSYHFELTQNASTRLWVAEWVDETEEGAVEDHRRRVVGMLVMWQIIDEGHIGTFAVHPDYRRRGIGRALLAHSLIKAAQAGIRKVFLEVRASNLAASALYHSFNFRVEGIRPRYYTDTQEDALLMTLEPLQEDAIRQLYPAAG